MGDPALEPLTIFWTAIGRADVPALEEAVREHDATLAHVTIGSLPALAIPALASGAVLVVCGTNREASLALSAGADEVLRAGEVSRESLALAIERARARATARSSRSLRRALLAEDDDVALGLLGAALSSELAAPLVSAKDEVAHLSQSLTPLLDASDDLVAWSSSTSEPGIARHIAARRLAAPAAERVKEGVERLDGALQRARAIVEGMLRLSRGPEFDVSASAVVKDVVDVLRGTISSAEISLETDGACTCATSRTAVVLSVTALIANALESIRAANRDGGCIAIRVFSAEDATIVEVEDNGGETADLRPEVFEAYFQGSSGTRRGLAGVRDRVRMLGGELMVETGPGGTTARLILPTADELAPREERGAPVLKRKALD